MMYYSVVLCFTFVLFLLLEANVRNEEAGGRFQNFSLEDE